MKLLIFCSKLIGLELLRSTLMGQDKIVAVIGKADRDIILDFCEKHGIQHIFDESYDSNLLTSDFDWLLNLWGSRIFNSNDISLAKNSLNVHPSLLPWGRGRDPIVHSILNRWPFGVSLHKIANDVDCGDLFSQTELNLKRPITGKDAYQEVLNRCITFFQEEWPKIRINPNNSFPQSGDFEILKRSKTEFLRRKTTADLDLSSENFLNWLLAFNFDNDYLPSLVIDGELVGIEIKIHRL